MMVREQEGKDRVGEGGGGGRGLSLQNFTVFPGGIMVSRAFSTVRNKKIPHVARYTMMMSGSCFRQGQLLVIVSSRNSVGQ
jgi:hypothetical protein